MHSLPLLFPPHEKRRSRRCGVQSMRWCDEMNPAPLLGWQGGESLHEKVLWEKEQMTERYKKSPAVWLGFWNGAQSIPTWCR